MKAAAVCKFCGATKDDKVVLYGSRDQPDAGWECEDCMTYPEEDAE